MLFLVHAAVDAVVGSASTSADSCDEQRTDTLKLAQAEIGVFATHDALHFFGAQVFSVLRMSVLVLYIILYNAISNCCCDLPSTMA